MIFYIILIIIFIFICIKQLLDYKYSGTFPTQIKILEIQKLYFRSIIFYIFGYTAYEIRGEGEKRHYHIPVIVKSNRKFKKFDEIKINKIDKNNYMGERIWMKC